MLPPTGKSRGNPKTPLSLMGDFVVLGIAMTIMFFGHVLPFLLLAIAEEARWGFRKVGNAEVLWAFSILLGCGMLAILLWGYDTIFGPGFPRRLAKILALAWVALFSGYCFSLLPDVAVKFILGASLALVIGGWIFRRQSNIRHAVPQAPAIAAEDNWLPADEPEEDPVEEAQTPNPA